jgi:hypothetical protein
MFKHRRARYPMSSVDRFLRRPGSQEDCQPPYPGFLASLEERR